jgi:hypothetical protein
MKKKSYNRLSNDIADEGEEEIKLYKDNNLSLNKKCSSFVIILIVIASLSIILNLILFYCINLGKNIRKKKVKYYWQEEKFKIEDYFLKVRTQYLSYQGAKYDDYNLITFQDKINWLIIHDSTPLKARCSDKILVHEYSVEKLGKDICNKIIKIYDNVEQINFDELPDKFAIKANHGNSYNIIVNDKKNLNINEAKQSLNKWLHADYGDYRKEFHYSFIKPKIFVEEFIGEKLKNYKFLCYSGVPKYIYVSIEDTERKYRNFYDMDWNFIDFHCLSEPHPTYQYPKPKFFEEMKELARKLSADFRFVRVDLYELENEVRLGELTFTPMNSFFNCTKKQDEI